MAFEIRELSGSLFKNDRQEHDRQPGYTGSCKIDGREYWISAWVKEPKSGTGKRFFSLSFQPKDVLPGGTTTNPGGRDKPMYEDDDLPF